MKLFRKSLRAYTWSAGGMLWLALTAKGALGTLPIQTLNLLHEATQDSWEWRLPEDVSVRVRVCQNPGITEQKGYAVFHFQTKSPVKVVMEFGLTPQLGRVVTENGPARTEHETRLEGLKPRGTEYYVRFRTEGAHSIWASPLLSFKTLLRYSYGYRFSPEDPRLRWEPGVPRIITGFISPRAPEVLQRIQDVDSVSYLQHIIETITRPQMSQLEKIKAIMTFVGDAVDHNALYLYTGLGSDLLRQDPKTGTLKPGGDREAVIVLELHYCRCGTVQLVTAALCRQIGVEAGRWEVPNGHHVSGRIKINGGWYFADEDAYKKGAFPLMPDGSLPPADWVFQGENIYLLDTKPGWIDFGSKGDWMLTKDGFLITGYVGGGHDQSEDGYPSAWFGGRVEFPPSLPQPLPVTHFGPGWVLLEWMGSYDRDNDFRNYLVEVGTGAGLSDIGRYSTGHAFYEVKLPHEGRYYWRVTATDAHASGTPYQGKVFYESSEASSFETAKLPQGPDAPPNLKSLRAPEDILFSLDPTDGSLGGFEPSQDTADEIGLAEGSYGGTGLFNVEWGKEGRVLELVDPTNRWGSGKVARRTWHNNVTATILPGDSWEMNCTVRTGRSYMAGNTSFPLLFVTDRTHPERAIGITLNPTGGTVSGAVKDSVSWLDLDAFDPQNRWHTYTVRFSPRAKAGKDNVSEQNVVGFFVDGKQIGLNTALSGAITPGSAWISSNPEADVTAWMSKIEIDRVRQ